VAFDEAEILVRAGAGGNGIVAFRREKYVPRGGPAGGDGGRGGDVVLLAGPETRTLLEISQRKEWRAQRGKDGGASRRHGSDGESLLLRVPVGTMVRDAERGHLLRDLDRAGERLLVAKGGRGGRGNARFATSTNRAPREREKGAPGEVRRLRLELRLLADVGLLGLPNSGKSTLLSRISKARPRIAAFPFTTLKPVLGIVETEEDRRLVFADIPGLVEGASRGKGLGDAFLRHVERTRLLLHLVDASDEAVVPPDQAHEIVVAELAAYSPALLERPRLLVATKADLPGAERGRAALERATGRSALPVSAARGEGLADLVRAVAQALRPAETGSTFSGAPPPAERRSRA
jgi:GTP-binding protein